MNVGRLAPLALTMWLALLGTCSWSTGGGKPQAKVFDPKQCGPDRVHCGGTGSTLCCEAKTQVCCSGVMQSYCAQSCPD
jgi:hypothetical protein